MAVNAYKIIFRGHLLVPEATIRVRKKFTLSLYVNYTNSCGDIRYNTIFELAKSVVLRHIVILLCDVIKRWEWACPRCSVVYVVISVINDSSEKTPRNL